MKNKIIALFLIISICLPVCFGGMGTAFADDNTYTKDIELIAALLKFDINPDMENQSITRRDGVLMSLALAIEELKNPVYKNEFSDISADDADAAKLAYALKLGIIPRLSTGRFNPDTKLSYIDAVKMIMNSLGYGQLVRSSKKGDTTYMSLAAKYDISIKPQNTYALSYGEMCHMIAAALVTPILTDSGVWGNGDIIYNESDNTTPLTRYWGIYKTEGQVTQNRKTALYDKDGLLDSRIVVNNVNLKCSPDTDTDMLLAREITAYYSKDDKELIYYEFTDDSHSIIMDSYNIDNFSSGTYYHNENNKVKAYPLTTAPAIIYNGVALTSAEAAYIEAGDIFVPSNGTVELVKNDGGSYSCIKITNYETYVVQGVDIDGKKIVDKYGKAVLELDDVKMLTLKNTDGEIVDFDYISSMNILSVAKSIDGTAADVIVCNDAVQGALTSYDSEEIQIEVEGFKMSDRIKEIINTNPMPALGEEIILYLDALGKAAVCETSPNNGWSFGYIIQKGTTGGLDVEYKLKLLTSDNKIEIIKFAKNLKLDAISYKGRLTEALSKINIEEPIKYRLNVNGELKEIDTWQVTNPEEGKNSLKWSYSSGEIRWVDYISSFSSETFIKSGSVTFTVPETPTGDERDYIASTVESSFVKDIDYKIVTFMEAEDELVDTLVVKKSTVNRGGSVSTEDIITVVDRVVNALDDEGNSAIKIYGMNTGIMRDYIVTDSAIKAKITGSNQLKRGDLVRINSNSRREVMALQKCFVNETGLMHDEIDGSIDGTPGANPYPDGLDEKFRLSYGNVLNMKNNIIQVKLLNSSKILPEKYYINGTVVVVDKNEIRAGSLADIVSDSSEIASSKVVVEMRYMRIRTIIVYKEV